MPRCLLISNLADMRRLFERMVFINLTLTLTALLTILNSFLVHSKLSICSLPLQKQQLCLKPMSPVHSKLSICSLPLQKQQLCLKPMSPIMQSTELSIDTFSSFSYCQSTTQWNRHGYVCTYTVIKQLLDTLGMVFMYTVIPEINAVFYYFINKLCDSFLRCIIIISIFKHFVVIIYWYPLFSH